RTGYDVPNGYIYRTNKAELTTRAPAGTELHELEQIEMFTGRVVEGTVVDSSGKPVFGVSVAVNWRDPAEEKIETTESAGIQARSWAMTDDMGHFRTRAMNPDVDMTLLPVRAGIELGPAITVASSSTKPVRLQIKEFDFVSLSGRIVDPAGKPLPRANITILVATDDNAKEKP